MVQKRKTASKTKTTISNSERSSPKLNSQDFSWSELAQTRLKQSILWPTEQINILKSKFSASTRSALTKKNDDLKLTSWFDVASGLVVGAITIDLPVTILMMATTSMIYGNSFNISAILPEALKSACISSLNFGLRNLMRKGDDGNLVGGLIGGALDRNFRQSNPSTISLLFGALNGGTYEFFRPAINNQTHLRHSIFIYGLIESADCCLSSLLSGKKLGKEAIATSALLGIYLATCISKLTIPYGNTIKKPLIYIKDNALDAGYRALSFTLSVVNFTGAARST